MQILSGDISAENAKQKPIPFHPAESFQQWSWDDKAGCWMLLQAVRRAFLPDGIKVPFSLLGHYLHFLYNTLLEFGVLSDEADLEKLL